MRFRKLVTILAALQGSWLSGGKAHAAWLEASSEHFVIYADDAERDITRFSQQLERYHAGMALLLGSTAPVPSPSNRVTVYVVRNVNEVRKLHGGNNKYLGGFYVPRAGGSLAIVPTVDSGNGNITMSMVLLLHEYAHHFLISSNDMPMPRWFNEGAAEFFASAKFEADGGVWLGRPAQHRAGELLDATGYEQTRPGVADSFYGKSWLLYHYLTFDDVRKGQLTRYVALLREGKGQHDAAVAAFGDFDVLEKDIDRYLGKNRMTALRLTADKVPIGPVTVRALPPGEAAMMPVRIRAKRGISPEDAPALLAEAKDIAARYPADPAVQSTLAECEYDAEHDKEAVAAADAALALDPRQVNAYVQKGLALFRLATEVDDGAAAYKKARAPFIALNRIENDHPLPLIYFYRSFVNQGETPPKLALDGLIRAMQLAPFDLGLRMNLGQALLHLGRHEDARVVLMPVAYNPHGGGMSESARAIIERMDKDPAWKGERGGAQDGDGETVDKESG